MQRNIKRFHLPPQPLHFGAELVGRHVIVLRHIAPVSLNPSSAAPLFESCTNRAYLSFIGTEILCQPTQASSSSSGFVLLAMMRLDHSVTGTSVSRSTALPVCH